MPTAVREIQVRIRVINPPPEMDESTRAEFGLQDKAGNLTPGTPDKDGSLLFECVLRASADDPPNFSGNYAQGTPKERFLYLSCRPVGEATAWIRRIKVMLGSITAEQVAQAGVLQTVVDGRRAARYDAVWETL